MIVHKKSGIEEIAQIINQLFQLVFGFISHYNWLGEGLSLMLLLFYCIFIKESQNFSQVQEVSGAQCHEALSNSETKEPRIFEVTQLKFTIRAT